MRNGVLSLILSFYPLYKSPVLSLAGIFKVVCRTFDHFVAGMKQMYEVNRCSSTARPGQPYGTMRTYYVAAEELEWDYAPNKTWALSGKDARY